MQPDVDSTGKGGHDHEAAVLSDPSGLWLFVTLEEQMGTRRFVLSGVANVAAERIMLVTGFILRTIWEIFRIRSSALSCLQMAMHPIQ